METPAHAPADPSTLNPQPSTPQQRSAINPEILQGFLESATNAADKGQAQFETPVDFARALAMALPRYRGIITDLNCGHGALLEGCANETTVDLLGLDIDPCRKRAVGVSPTTGAAGNPGRQDSGGTFQRAVGVSPTTGAAGNPGRQDAGGTLSPGRQDARFSRITHDLTLAYPMMVEVDLCFDLLALNSPWDLHWSRERLAALADSKLPAVRAAFRHFDPRLSRDEIDSTIATLMIALDRGADKWGEGFIIANEATLQRLIFNEGAPHAALAEHVWLHLVFAGNPCTGSGNSKFQNSNSKENSTGGAPVSQPAFPRDVNSKAGLETGAPMETIHSQPSTLNPQPSFQTGVLFFARGHTFGPMSDMGLITNIQEISRKLVNTRLHYRRGAQATEYCFSPATKARWVALKEEIAARHKPERTDWNLWLQHGAVRVNLSLFEQSSVKINKAEAKKLFELNGKRPMQLVMLREEREYLQRAVGVSPTTGAAGNPGQQDAGGTLAWRVQPELRAAVQKALSEYLLARAPLYPLDKIKRLGYLDEQDVILCVASLEGGTAAKTPNSKIQNPRKLQTPNSKLQTSPVFLAGKTYKLASRTVCVKRWSEKPNYVGEMETLELSGQELAFDITDEHGVVRTFMDKTALAQGTDVGGKKSSEAIDFTLEQLVEHFEIPEVPDVAAVNPEKYQENIRLLREVEEFLAE